MVDTVNSFSASLAAAPEPAAPTGERSRLAENLAACRNVLNKISGILIGVTEAGLTGAATGACIGALTVTTNQSQIEGVNRIMTGMLYGGVIAAGIRITTEIADLFSYAYSTDYHPDNDGKFPLLTAGQPIKLRIVFGSSICDKYRFDRAEQYLNTEGLAERYHQKLGLKAASEPQGPDNNGLSISDNLFVGQDHVVAKTAIRQGDCLGIAGGEVASRAALLGCEPLMRNNKALMKYTVDIGNDQLIIGQNILSRVKTVYEFDPQSDLYNTASERSNTEMVFFPALTDESPRRALLVPVLFAIKDIAPGEVLISRVGYPNGIL